jgi:hypothetical protein
MQPEPLSIAGIAGPVAVKTNWFTGRSTITVGGQQIPTTGRGRFALPTTSGQTTEARVRAQMLDPYATVEVGGQKYRTGPAVPLGVRIVGLLPLLLVFWGGLVGGLIGALGVAANFWVIREVKSTALKVLALVGVLAVTVVIWLVVGTALVLALR